MAQAYPLFSRTLELRPCQLPWLRLWRNTWIILPIHHWAIIHSNPDDYQRHPILIHSNPVKSWTKLPVEFFLSSQRYHVPLIRADLDRFSSDGSATIALPPMDRAEHPTSENLGQHTFLNHA